MKNGIKNILISRHYKSKNSKILLGIVNQKGRQISSVGVNDKSQTPIEDRVFEIGSISKVFTAALLQTMISDNLIQLNDPIIKFQPKYVQAFSTDEKEITLKDLITHHANLPKYPPNIKIKDKMNPFATYRTEDLDQFLSSFKLKNYKRKFKYSNVGVGLLGNILANVLDKKYEEAVKTRICKPLDMHSTFVHLSDIHRKRIIKAYRKNKEVPSFSAPALQGAGILKSTLNDMLTFLEANLGLIDHPLQHVFNETHYIQNNISMDNNTLMGLGWMVTKNKQIKHNIHWHNGGTVGFNTYIGMIKDKKLGIIIATTQKHSIWKLMKIILGLNKPIADEIAAEVLNHLSTE